MLYCLGYLLRSQPAVKGNTRLNEAYTFKFYDLPFLTRDIEYTLNSKAQYDRCDLSSLWEVYVDEHRTYLEDRLRFIHQNQRMFLDY